MKYNPLKTDMNKKKNKPVKKNFDKKQKGEIVNEKNVRRMTPNKNEPERRKSTNSPMTSNPNTNTNKTSIDSLINNPLFYRKLLKENPKLISGLTEQIRSQVFEDNKQYIKKLVENNIKHQTNKALIDFKVDFADFIKTFMKKQLDVSINTTDLVTLRSEIEQIRLNSTMPIQNDGSILNDKSAKIEAMVEDLRKELVNIRGSISEIKENESRLESKLDSSISQVNFGKRESLTDLDSSLKSN